MLIYKLSEIINTQRDVMWGNGQSRRFLLKNDGMGFTVADTIINAGTESKLQYVNHLEACYCVSGTGEIIVDGVSHELHEGVLYALNKNDKHILRAFTTLRLISIFYPALLGEEKHDLDKEMSHY